MEKTDAAGKTIGIIENSRNKKLISNLEKSGNKILKFPEPRIEIIKMDLFRKINDFDWIIFTDLYAADYFLRIFQEDEIDFFVLDALRICALGEAVADRLRFRQVHTDVIPPDNRTVSVISALSDYIFDDDFSEQSFLIIKESNAAGKIAELLSEKNARVQEVSVYKSFFEEVPEIPKLKALLKGGGIDEFIFNSPEDVFCLSRLFKDERLGKVFSGIKIKANDEITWQSFNENR